MVSKQNAGMFVPETLMAPLHELTRAYAKAKRDPSFRKELNYYQGLIGVLRWICEIWED